MSLNLISVSPHTDFVSRYQKVCHRSGILCHEAIFFEVMEIDYYKLQANISSFLVSGLFPILISYGIGEATSNLIITVISYVIVLAVCLWSERFTSTFLTKKRIAEEEEIDQIDSETA